MICETEETGRSNRLSGFDDLFWEHSDRFRGGTAVVAEAAEICQYFFFKIIKKTLARLNSGLACGIVAGIGDPGRGFKPIMKFRLAGVTPTCRGYRCKSRG